RLQLAERVVDQVFAAAGDGEGELVLREEVRDADDVEDRRALADAGGDPFEPPSRRELLRQLLRERANIRRVLASKPFELVERLLEPLGFDRLEQVVD